MSLLKRADNDQHWRRVLYRRYPHCHWCRVRVFDPNEIADKSRPDMATLDHIKSRLQCTTKQEYRAEKNKVLACQKCNADRDREFHLRTQPWRQAAERCVPPWQQWVYPMTGIYVAPELGEAMDGARNQAPT